MSDVLKGQTFNFVSQSFDKVTASQWVRSINDATFVTDDLLGAKSNTSRTFGRQAERFVKTVGVQTLGSTHDRSH